jgi:hypothetical protein
VNTLDGHKQTFNKPTHKNRTRHGTQAHNPEAKQTERLRGSTTEQSEGVSNHAHKRKQQTTQPSRI